METGRISFKNSGLDSSPPDWVKRVRRVEGAHPFVPFGLVPVVFLVLVLLMGTVPLAYGAVESVAERTARQALDSVHATWARARADGQWVVLEGAAPTRGEADAAIAAVNKAKAPTLFGEAKPITKVWDRFTVAAASSRVEDLAAAAAIVPAAKPTPAPPVASPETQASPAVPAPSSPAVVACDKSLADVLGAAKIEFGSNSATIGKASDKLLDSVASAAKACPGKLQIEGYTDDEGSSKTNDKLGLDRALSVKEELVKRGVPASRLTVKGMGTAKPLASNKTEEGRDRNRRIEMRVVPSSIRDGSN